MPFRAFIPFISTSIVIISCCAGNRYAVDEENFSVKKSNSSGIEVIEFKNKILR